MKRPAANNFAPRTPWPVNFPRVAVHSDTALRDRHPAYEAAKAGNEEAAFTLVEDLLSAVVTDELRQLIGNRAVILLPITALETTGFNAIPDAMAQVLGADLGQPVSSGEIVQNNTVGHTRARAFNRMVTPAAFEGNVRENADYLLIDDHVGLGGTLANLKGYTEVHGGRVIGMTTLTQSRDAAQIALQPDTLDVLRERHGDALEQFWNTWFGHGLDCLTDVEGQNLCRLESIDAIANRLAEAAIEVRGRGVEPAVDLRGQ